MVSAHLSRCWAIAFAIATLSLATGCGDDEEEDAPPPKPAARGYQPTPVVEPGEQEEPPPEDPFAEPAPERDPFPAEIPKYEPEVEEEQAEQAEPEPRKYDQELASAVGSPAECMEPRTAAGAPEEVSVEIEAHVLETGYISRGSARSSVLNEAEIDCVRKRIERARLPPEVEDAPRRITTRISLKLRVTPDTTTPSSTQ
jgi:hypothetical protein